MTIFILLDWEDGTPTVYVYEGYEDEKYGWQPATHLDYIYKV